MVEEIGKGVNVNSLNVIEIDQTCNVSFFNKFKKSISIAIIGNVKILLLFPMSVVIIYMII